MDTVLVVDRLAQQIASMRKARGLTLVELAARSGVTRQKLAEIEKGSPTVSINLYAKVLAALGAELQVIPARRPVFEELQEVFR
ncbi:helix-turn-helix domain-containing protein [Pseudomonas sp. DSP3-2-2]|uniref:helix-turn-helix domain-containing protein n=1 Tax=unclassified Pseudomonas TaxID=196821 RepID=UPI003CE9D96B